MTWTPYHRAFVALALAYFLTLGCAARIAHPNDPDTLSSPPLIDGMPECEAR